MASKPASSHSSFISSTTSLKCPYPEKNWTLSTAPVSIQDIESIRLEDKTGVEIYFLPSVKDLESNESFRRAVSKTFHVPSFFWTKMAYDANGFFEGGYQPIEGLERGYSSQSRFLIKELKPNATGGGYTYDWEYLAFATLWYTPDTVNVPATQILLCFDLSSNMKDLIIERIKAKEPDLYGICPYAIYDTLMETVVSYFDQALWGFRIPVRHVENTRLDTANNSKYDLNTMSKRYLEMHELARHIIHKKETLNVSSRSLKAMIKSHSDRCPSPNDGTAVHCSQTKRGLQFFEAFLENLRDRADAFNERLHNEIVLAFNLSAADDNATAKDILSETRNDNRDLTNLVSLLTLIFLPGSFFTGFFGMNFFDYNTDDQTTVATNLWLFFAVTVPVTLAAISMWRFYKWNAAHRRARKGKMVQSSNKLLKHTSTFPVVV